MTLNQVVYMARQWCLLHDCHQDDPRHAYNYYECEANLRPSRWLEDLRLIGRRLIHTQDHPAKSSNTEEK